MTDAELVERARSGSTPAFDELVERHRHAVVRTAFAALGSLAEAEDAAQDACVLAYRRLGQFRGDASFKTWLLSITWRTAMSRRRRLARWLHLAVGADEDATARQFVSPSASPEAVTAGAEAAAMVRRCVMGLPSRLRQPLLLAAAGEMTYEEIARMLDVPLGTLKWRVSEARRQLKQRLARVGIQHA